MRLTISTLLVLASLTWAATRCHADDRPNILFAFADDWGQYASAYARLKPGTPSDLVSTPNFDRIAKEGVLFTRAFVNAPSCTPCRSSLLSGQYFWRTGRGAILQGAIWDSSIPSFPLILKDRGYHIGFTYKVWSPGTPADAPYGGQGIQLRKARQPPESVLSIRRRAAGYRSRQADRLRTGPRECSRFLEGSPARQAVLLLVRADRRASRLGRRLRQGLVGPRPRSTPGKASQVSARRAGGAPGFRRLPRRRSRPSTRRWAWSWRSWKRPVNSRIR